MNHRLRISVLMVVVAMTTTAWAENAVVIESITVPGGASEATVGVYIQNDITVYALVLPLEFRSLDPGAFIAGSLTATVEGRLAPWNGDGGFGVSQFYAQKEPGGHVQACPPDVSGEVWLAPDTAVDFISPDAYLYAVAGIDSLEAGTDGSPSSGTPSIVFTFGVTGVTGSFEIDTMCTWPSNHLVFGVHRSLGPTPAFTKGTVTIGCACDCHTDPECDSVHNVVDLVKIIDVAFRGGDSIPDPNPLCPYETTDVDCDDDTDVLDVTKMNQVVNYGADPDSMFCDACP